MQRTIVIEQRLSTYGLFGAIVLIAIVVTGIVVTLSSTVTYSGDSPITEVLLYGVPLLLLAVALLSFTIVVRVVATPQGRSLEVVYGPGGYVRQVFAADEIVSASAQELSFAQMGGWGYRGSLRLLKYAALATRRGEALQVQLTRRRRFVVTVDEAQAFADALNS